MSRPNRILVLDDEADIASLVRQALEMDGHEVEVATDIDEFRRIDAEQSFDVYILDLMLPRSNGFEVAREIRRSSDAGIVMLTGQTGEVDVVLGLEVGADDYISKPFRSRELRARVGSVIRRRERWVPPADQPAREASPGDGPDERDLRRFGNWTLNLAARKLVHESGSTADLTTSEFEVLSYLVRSAGRVVTRSQIMDAIRGEDWAAYDRLIDGLVSRIRRKMDRIDTAANPIRTIRGIGYLFESP